MYIINLHDEGHMDSNSSLSENSGCYGFILKILGFAKKPPKKGLPKNGPHKLDATVFKGNPGLRASWEQYQEKADSKQLPYQLRDDFLSFAEISFYHVLKQMVGSVLVVHTKVNLADIFYVARPNENAKYWNKINRKHVDFLLCNAKTLKPFLGIELDDRSHQRKDRVERDAFVDEVFKVAGLPIVRVPAAMTYSTKQLGQLFQNAVTTSVSEKNQQTSMEESQMQQVASIDTAPLCPKCDVPMVLRKAKRGSHKGKPFYGCVNYPKCREMIPVADIEGKSV